MSTTSKVTLATTLAGTIGIVVFVHWAQKAEQSAMHAGVIRDEANQQRKKAEQEERRIDFEMQRQLEQACYGIKVNEQCSNVRMKRIEYFGVLVMSDWSCRLKGDAAPAMWSNQGMTTWLL